MQNLSPAADDANARPNTATVNSLRLHSLAIEHRTRLHRFVLRRIGHDDDAHDIAQQAFAAAAIGIERFRGQCELSTWLYGIAMNLVRNYLNRAPHRVHRFETDERLSQVPTSRHEDPLEALSRQQMVRQLMASLEGLPPKMQEVLRLVGIEEMSCDEAAAALGVPPGTVRSRLSRARAALRAAVPDVNA